MLRVWPLTGREIELATVRDLIHTSPGPRGVVIAGAVGVGKTRVAQEALALARRRGGRSHWLAATACSRALPLGIFAEILPEAVDGDAFAVFQRVTSALSEPDCDVAVAVDDAHLVDDLSAAVLLQLVSQERVTVIITVRSGEPVPDAVAAIWKEGLLDRIELQPLTEIETVTMLEAGLRGLVEAEAARALIALSGGNPLYLRQVVLGELRSGRLSRSGPAWSWRGPFEASAELTDLIERQLRDVPAPARDVLDLLSLVGDLDANVLLTHVTRSALEAAESAGVVAVDATLAGCRVRAGHPLFAEIRRAGIPQVKARRLRGEVGRSLSGQALGSSATMLRGATLSLDSDQPPDPDLLASAADEALQRLDFPLAERLASAAVAGAGGKTADLLLAYAQGFGDHTLAAAETCRRLEAAARSDLDMVRLTVASAGHAFFMLARPEEAVATLERGRKAIASADTAKTLTPLQSVFELCLGRPEEAVRLAAEALRLPDPSPQETVFTMCALVGGLGLLGRTDKAISLGVRAWAAGGGSFDSAILRLRVVYFEVLTLSLAGYVARADSLGSSRLEEIGSGTVASFMGQGVAGSAALAAGAIRTATQRLVRAWDVLAPTDTSGWSYLIGIALTSAYAQAGETELAEKLADETVDRRHPGHVWAEPALLLSQAWVAASRGALSEARQIAHRAAVWAHDHGQLADCMYALATAVRFGDRSVAPALADLVGRVDGPRCAISAGHADALLHGDGDGLALASRQFEQMGDMLSAADASAQAAAAYERAGLNGSRLTAAARAFQLQERTEGAQTPALRAAARPLPLSDRELEIVTLTAQGLSNREIAARLVVSVRTVEGHLYRVGGKLGTSSRADLAQLLASR